MNIDARISKEWRRRMLLLFIMNFGISAWFLSDGYYFWPSEDRRFREYSNILEELMASGKAKDADSASVELAWKRHAREANYTFKVPKERSESAVKEQRIIGWTLGLGSLIFLGWIIWNHTRSIKVEGETVIGICGKRVHYDMIFSTDRKKWKTKGIAYALYNINGKTKRLCLDDHKFAGCEAILLEAEKRIKGRGKI